jgi:hypothetical protein
MAEGRSDLTQQTSLIEKLRAEVENLRPRNERETPRNERDLTRNDRGNEKDRNNGPFNPKEKKDHRDKRRR